MTVTSGCRAPTGAVRYAANSIIQRHSINLFAYVNQGSPKVGDLRRGLADGAGHIA